jgi:hypothetical protein
LIFDELRYSVDIVNSGSGSGGGVGFLPAVRQIANVAALPGNKGFN